jgi:Spy/CpxP family protein refolding chaperone
MLSATALAAGAVLTAASITGVASAAEDTAATTTPPPGPGGWKHHGRHGWGLGHLYRQLGLTAQQKASIKTILTNAEPQLKSLHEQLRANQQKLWQTLPSASNYQTVVAEVAQANGALDAQLITQKATIGANIFNTVLTSAQQSQLIALEAKIQAAHAARAPQ